MSGRGAATLVVNKLRGHPEGVRGKAPGFGDRRKEMMIDIEKITGGRSSPKRRA